MATFEDIALLSEITSDSDTYLHDIAQDDSLGAAVNGFYVRDKYGLLTHTFWETTIMAMIVSSMTNDEILALCDNTSTPLVNDVFKQAPERTPTYVRMRSPINNIITLHISMSWMFKWINRLNDCIDRYLPKEMYDDFKIDSMAFMFYESAVTFQSKHHNTAPIGSFWRGYRGDLKSNVGSNPLSNYKNYKTDTGFYIHGRFNSEKGCYLNFGNNAFVNTMVCEKNSHVPLNYITALHKSENGVFNESDAINIESSGIPYMIQTGAPDTPIEFGLHPSLFRHCFHALNDLTSLPYTNTTWCVGRIHPVFFNKKGETLNNPCFGWDVTTGLASLFSQTGVSNSNFNVAYTIYDVAKYNYVNTDLYNWYKDYNPVTSAYSQNGFLDYVVKRVYNSVYYYFPDYDKLFSLYGRSTNFTFKIPPSNMYTANGHPYRVHPTFGNTYTFGSLCFRESVKSILDGTTLPYGDTNILIDPDASSMKYSFTDYNQSLLDTQYICEGLIKDDVKII